MHIHRFKPWMLGVIGLSAALALIALVMGRLNSGAGATSVCPTDWADPMNNTMSRACEEFLITTKQTVEAHDLAIQLTQAVLITPNIQPNSLPPGAVTATPGGLLTTPLVAIQQFDPGEAADGPETLRRSKSIWGLGRLPARTEYDIDTLYVLTRAPYPSGHTTIYTVVDGGDIGPDSWPQYNGHWQAPQEIGTALITGITNLAILPNGLTGTVAFTTTTGASGTFDLATHTWTITAAGTPVVPPPPSAPSATPYDMKRAKDRTHARKLVEHCRYNR